MAAFQSKRSEFYSRFLRAHEMFKENLEPILQADKPVLLFGASKAGKSTFMARVMSPLGASEFVAQVHHIVREKIEVAVADINIGGTNNSTTLIPLMKRTGTLQIVDLPGFRDADESRDIMIQLFHKATLSRVIQRTQPQVVVVVDAQKLYDIPNFANQYHLPLRELFGEGAGYAAFLDNAHFVFTHIDEFKSCPKYTTGLQIRNLLSDAVCDVTDGADPTLAKLLKRMKMNHVEIDYTVHDQRACLEILAAELTKAPPQQGIPGIAVQSIEIMLNKANVWVLADIEVMLAAAVEQTETGARDIASRFSHFDSICMTYSGLSEELVKLRQLIHTTRTGKDAAEKQCALDRENHREREGVFGQLQDRLRSAKEAENGLREVLKGAEIPRKMRFRSRPRKEFTGPAFKFAMELAPEHHAAHVVMVDPGANFDVKQFKDERKTAGAQPHITRVNQSKQPHLNKAVQGDGSVLVTADSSSSFDIIIVDFHNVEDGEELDLLLSVLNRETVNVMKTLVTVEAELNVLSDSIQAHDKTIKFNIDSLEKLANQRNELQRNMDAQQEQLHHEADELKASILTLTENFNARFLDEKAIGNISKMIAVFQEHKLSSSALVPFDKYQKTVKDFCVKASQTHKEIEKAENSTFTKAATLARQPSNGLGAGARPPSAGASGRK